MSHRLFAALLTTSLSVAALAPAARAQSEDWGTDETVALTADEAPASAAAPACGSGTERVVHGSRTIAPPAGMKFRSYLARSCWPSYNIDNQGDLPGSAKSRSGTAIKMIVLHETTGDVGLSNKSKHLVHFYIDNDGTVFQTMDLDRYGEHASDPWVNQRSIGIEISNNFRQGSCPKGRDCVPVTTSAAYQWVLTRRVQLEAAHQLVQFLLANVPTVPGTWIPMEHQTSTARYFLYGTTGGQPMMKRLNDAECKKPASPFERAACAGGVLQHSAVFDRDIDGAAPLLYTWLRPGAASAAAAYADLQCILSTADKPAGKADPLMASDAELGPLVATQKVFARFVQVSPLPVCISADEAQAAPSDGGGSSGGSGSDSASGTVSSDSGSDSASGGSDTASGGSDSGSDSASGGSDTASGGSDSQSNDE